MLNYKFEHKIKFTIERYFVTPEKFMDVNLLKLKKKKKKCFHYRKVLKVKSSFPSGLGMMI